MKSMVLIVDDDDKVRASLKKWLSASFSRYKFVEATSGEEAVLMSRENEPVLVIMDVTMPGISGIEATRLIKSARPATHVVMLTIHNEEAYRSTAESAGACAFVCKERAPVALMPVLKRLLG